MPESLFLKKKETLVQVISCEFCKIFRNNYFHRTPTVAASEMTGIYETIIYSLFFKKYDFRLQKLE